MFTAGFSGRSNGVEGRRELGFRDELKAIEGILGDVLSLGGLGWRWVGLRWRRVVVVQRFLVSLREI